MKELFLQWLDDQGLLEIYLLELLASDWTQQLQLPNDFLESAFNWEESCSGHSFWLSVNKEWRNHMQSFNERF